MSKDRDDFDANEWGNIGPDSMLDPKWSRKKTQAMKDAQQKIMKVTIAKKLKNDPDMFIKQNRAIADNVKKKREEDPAYNKQYENMLADRGKNWSNKFNDKEYAKEYGLDISKNTNAISEKDAFDIYYACLEPRLEVRTSKFMKTLAKKYNVSLGKIRYVAYGDHYAFGGRKLHHKNIRIEHEHINPAEDLEKWKNKVIGKFVWTSPEGKVYEQWGFTDAGEWMCSMDNSVTNDYYMKGFKKLGSLKHNEPKTFKQRFWKGWTCVNINEREDNEN